MGKIKITKLKRLGSLFQKDWAVIFAAALVLSLSSIMSFQVPAVYAQEGGDSAATKAKNHCQDKHTSNEAKRKACVKGFTAGYNGGNKADACKSYRGGVKDACNSGFDAGKNAKDADSAPPPDEGAAGAAEGQGTEEIKCEASIFSISWIICAAIEFGANFTNWFFNSFLRPLLEEVPVSLDPAEGSFQAWQGFRLLANIMLVASMLAIVYAQARGDQ